MNPILHTRSAVLLTLLHDGPGYGLQLIERIATRSRNRIQLLDGLIYGVLVGLEKEGMLTTKEGAALPGRGGLRPREHTLTIKGIGEALEVKDALAGILRLGEAEVLSYICPECGAATKPVDGGYGITFACINCHWKSGQS